MIRYDLLCFEGLSLALRTFLGLQTYPIYTLSESEYSLTVHKSTAQVREYGVAAVLRGIHFTQRSYDSFIGLQEKIHQNLGRQRTLVSIGTHDLDKTQGPYTYEALPPEDISFVPLNQTRKMNGRELVAFYDETDPRHIGRYLHIIRDAPVYPVMLDARRQVLSLPPIINSEYSKIDLRTRNIFIDITATDLTKMDIALNIITTMFAMHLDTPFTIEPVQVVSVHNNLTRITPNLQPRIFNVSVSYLNSCTGLDNSPDRITQYLKKMCLQAETTSKTDVLKVTVPVTRADVLHQCDVMEDYAVAYGFNSLPRAGPERAATTGQAFPLNKLTDIVRQEVALSGWTEVLPLILCSTEENFDLLRRKDDGSTAVRLANPKTFEYQVVRTTLLPGLLKTIRENKSHSLPLKIFEVSDIVVKDASKERASRNERRLAAIWTGLTSGFEIVQGLLDRVMVMLQIDALSVTNGTVGYWIEESNGRILRR